jgi:hypothetical protein
MQHNVDAEDVAPMMPPMRPLDHNTAGCDARLKLLKLPDTRPDPFLHRRRAVMLRKPISGKSAIDASYSHFSRLDQRVGRFIDPDQDWRRGRFAPITLNGRGLPLLDVRPGAPLDA